MGTLPGSGKHHDCRIRQTPISNPDSAIGYISQALFEELFHRGLQLVTTIRKNMKPRIVLLWDKLMLQKRSLTETVNDQFKNICQVDHTRHRSVNGFIVNLLAGLIAYPHQPKKPCIRFDENEEQQLAIIP